jgi:hypothetical protein
MNPITICHIEHPTEDKTLCNLNGLDLWADDNDLVELYFLEESVGEDLFLSDSSKCSICWRDEEERILMLLANT